MDSNELRSLEQALGYPFKKPELIIEALTHRSHHHEHGDSFHNERLEFLGDAVLDLCVTEIVMDLSPTTNEGHLSKLRSQLVSEQSLARAARRLDLGHFVRLGRGEEQSGGRDRDALLADTLEAVFAAIYRDGGLVAVRDVVSRVMKVDPFDADDWEKASWTLLTQDFKSRLQEFCQSVGLGTPTYLCLESTGPDHNRRFTMALKVQDIEVSRAEGQTKKEATQKAARAVLELCGGEPGLEAFFKAQGFRVRQNRAKSATTTTSASARQRTGENTL